MIKKILLFLFLSIFSLYLANAAGNEHYTIYYGSLTIDGSEVSSGQTLSATIGGTDAGSTTISTTGEYKLIVTLPTTSSSGDEITFSLSIPSGYSSVTDIAATNYNTANDEKYVNLDLGFSGTATTTTAAPSEGGDGGSAMAAPAAPKAPESLKKITDLTKINDIIASLPEGWTNVDVYQVGESKSETVTKSLESLLTEALKHATDPKAISALQNIQNKLKSGELLQLSVTKTLNVYKITNKDNGQSVFRSKITLTFTAPNDIKNVKIVEVVPHAVVDSIEGIDFPGEKPEVLQNDPIFQWTFDLIRKDVTNSLDYIIKKKVDNLDSIKTVAASEKGFILPVMSKSVMGVMIIVIIVLIGLAVYYQYLKKKEKR